MYISYIYIYLFYPHFPWEFSPKNSLVAKMQANLRDLARQSVQDGDGRRVWKDTCCRKGTKCFPKKGANFKTERIRNSNRTVFFQKTHGGFPRV